MEGSNHLLLHGSGAAEPNTTVEPENALVQSKAALRISTDRQLLQKFLCVRVGIIAIKDVFHPTWLAGRDGLELVRVCGARQSVGRAVLKPFSVLDGISKPKQFGKGLLLPQCCESLFL